MNLDMFRPENRTEDFKLSIPKNCETLNHQTQLKLQGTLEFRLKKPRETSYFKPCFIFGLESIWLLGLTSLKFYNSFFNITQYIKKLDLYTDLFDEFSLTELKHEVEEKILHVSSNSHKDLQERRSCILLKHTKK